VRNQNIISIGRRKKPRKSQYKRRSLEVGGEKSVKVHRDSEENNFHRMTSRMSALSTSHLRSFPRPFAKDRSCKKRVREIVLSS